MQGFYVVDWVERFRLFVFFFADAFVEKIDVFGHLRFDDHQYAKVEEHVHMGVFSDHRLSDRIMAEPISAAITIPFAFIVSILKQLNETTLERTMNGISKEREKIVSELKMAQNKLIDYWKQNHHQSFLFGREYKCCFLTALAIGETYNNIG